MQLEVHSDISQVYLPSEAHKHILQKSILEILNAAEIN